MKGGLELYLNPLLVAHRFLQLRLVFGLTISVFVNTTYWSPGVEFSHAFHKTIDISAVGKNRALIYSAIVDMIVFARGDFYPSHIKTLTLGD